MTRQRLRIRRGSVYGAAITVLFCSASALAQPDDTGASADAEEPPPAGGVRQELGVTGGLTAEMVAARATATSYDVKARADQVRQAEASVDRSIAAYIPRTTLTGRYSRVSNISNATGIPVVVAPGAPAGPLPPNATLISASFTFPVLLNQYLLQANLSAPISDYFLRFPQSLAAAKNEVSAAKFNEAGAKRSAATSARLAYYGWVVAKLQTEIAEQALTRAEGHLIDVRTAAGVGAATQADVLAVQAQVASSGLLVEQSRSQTRASDERIRTLMHGGAPRELTIGENIQSIPAPLDPGATVETLFQKARTLRPELKAMDAHAAALRKRASVESAGMLPRLDGFASASYSNPNSRVLPPRDEFRGSWEVGGTLTWTISDVPSASASVRGVDAELAATLADQKALEDSIRLEISDALEATREADANVRPALDQLASATEAYRVRRELFRAGRATSVELTDSESELTKARIEELDSHVNQRVARVKLAHAVGG